MKKSSQPAIRIGNGAGFWGDSLDAPLRLVSRGKLDYLTLEYLAELTLSILAHQRRRDPTLGYVSDFPRVLESLIPQLRVQPGLRIVTNAGGLNPEACAHEIGRRLTRAGLFSTRIAWITGDDLLDRLPELQGKDETFQNFDDHTPLRSLNKTMVSANAYMGAFPIASALDQHAQIVITGRVADASLTLGPAIHEFRWGAEDWDHLAGGSVAGHLIECGAQVTGGMLTRWKSIEGYSEIGYPIAELISDGSCILTKPEGTGGRVNRESVTEQLLYEIGDPAHYLTPDVDVDFTGIEMEELQENRVRVYGAKGNPAPKTLKVSCAYDNGFMAQGELVVTGMDAVEKAKACGSMILGRLQMAGIILDRHHVEILGTGECLPGVKVPTSVLREVVLRVAVHDARKEAVERFCREISPLITSGPQGLAGYANSRPQARPVLSYWPTLVSRKQVQPQLQTMTAGELSA